MGMFAELSLRSMKRTLRQPIGIVFPIVFPLFVLAVNVGGLSDASEIPGYPTDNVLDFLLGFTFIQGALFAATGAGTDIARDIETGFLSRLSLTPIRPPALVLAELAGAVMMGLITGIVYLAVAFAAGANVAAGPLGVVLLVALSMLLALAFGSLGGLMAIRVGTGESVQGLFPLLFVFVFLSTAIMPRDLISSGWFRTVATINPVSYLVEGIRSLVIDGWDPVKIWITIGVGAAIAAIALSLGVWQMRTRLGR